MYKHVLVAIDLNEESSYRKALPAAAQLCRSFGAELHVMTVVPDFGMSVVAQYFPPDFEKRALADADHRLRAVTGGFDLDGVPVHYAVGHGTIYREIIRAADSLGVDLVVMASHRPQLSDYLLGPNAASVVRHARQSVLVVRQ